MHAELRVFCGAGPGLPRWHDCSPSPSLVKTQNSNGPVYQEGKEVFCVCCRGIRTWCQVSGHCMLYVYAPAPWPSCGLGGSGALMAPPRLTLHSMQFGLSLLIVLLLIWLPHHPSLQPLSVLPPHHQGSHCHSPIPHLMAFICVCCSSAAVGPDGATRDCEEKSLPIWPPW